MRLRSCRDRSNAGVPASARATSRACSWMLREILHIAKCAPSDMTTPTRPLSLAGKPSQNQRDTCGHLASRTTERLLLPGDENHVTTDIRIADHAARKNSFALFVGDRVRRLDHVAAAVQRHFFLSKD